MTANYGTSSWVSGLLFCHVWAHCAETRSCSWAVSLSVSGQQQDPRRVSAAKTCWMFTSVYKGWTRGRAAGITVCIRASLLWRCKTFSTQSGAFWPLKAVKVSTWPVQVEFIWLLLKCRGHCAVRVARSRIKQNIKKFLVIAPLTFFSWTVPGLFWTQFGPTRNTQGY